MFYFRVDSNPHIASGHVMRCVSMATYFMDMGEDVHFIVADGNPIVMLKQANLPYTVLNTPWNNLLIELPKMIDILSKKSKSVLFIDTYQVVRKYIEALLPFAKIGYIGSKKDFLGNIHCLINYSADIDQLFYSKNYTNSTKLLLGPLYAPLRKEFQNIEEHYQDEGFHILVTTGNTDSSGCIIDILTRFLHKSIFSHIQFEVVIGNMFIHTDKMKKIFGQYENIHFHYQVSSMSNLMKMCSLAIAANGTTVYELAAAKVPIISFAMVNEQVVSAEALHSLGVIEYAGEYFSQREKVISNIEVLVTKYYSSPELLKILGQKASKIIDGNGCQRIYDEIKQIME